MGGPPKVLFLTPDCFKVIPENCLVVEDSRNGTLAAKAAEMTCVGYINEGSGNQDLSEADLIVDSLSSPLLSSFFKK